MFSTRAHWLTIECQPMMPLEMQACFLMRTPRITLQRESLTLDSTMQPGLITTSGPFKHPFLILAVSLTMTFPIMQKPEASLDEDFFLNESRQSLRLLMQSLGCPMSIQKPGSPIAKSLFSATILGMTSFSIEVGLSSIVRELKGSTGKCQH